jgi:hypothetical protein
MDQHNRANGNVPVMCTYEELLGAIWGEEPITQIWPGTLPFMTADVIGGLVGVLQSDWYRWGPHESDSLARS